MLLGCLIALAWVGSPAPADEKGSGPSLADIDHEAQGIKQEILDINRELSLIEDALLHPPDRRLTVFLSLSSDAPLTLNLLELGLNGNSLVRHRYSGEESEALRKGGVHKPYVGRLAAGDYRFTARLSGTDRRDRAFDLTAELAFEKVRGTKYLELKVTESGFPRKPELTIHHW